MKIYKREWLYMCITELHYYDYMWAYFLDWNSFSKDNT